MNGYKYTLSGRADRAIPHFLKIRDLDVGMRDYILYYLGKALLAEGRCGEARGVMEEIARGYPESRWAPVAGLQATAREPCPPLIQPPVPPEKGIACEGLRVKSDRADCLFRSRRYQAAKGLYRELVEEGTSRRGVFYLVRLSQAAARSQDFETALGANRTLRERYPEEASDALRKIAFLHQDRGDYRSAILVLGELLDEARSPEERRLYRERIGWCRFRLAEYPEAVRSFDSGLEEGETPFLLYWKGRALERVGEKREAGELFRFLVDVYGGSYYGIRALERSLLPSSVMRGWWHPVKGGIRWKKAIVSLENGPDLERIYELSSLGLLQDAVIEGRRARARLGIPLPRDPKKIRERGGEWVFETRLPKEEEPDHLLPYADFLFSEMKQVKVKTDPLLVFAMMKQESRFRETVVSPAGAVGLMQIMPGTGRRLAGEAGWEEYRSDWLADPLTNAELAIRYLKKLSDLFDGNWYTVAAAYNAGEQVVGEWLSRKKDLQEEEFIEEIPYQETRNYLKKVYANWRAYRFIYGGSGK